MKKIIFLLLVAVATSVSCVAQPGRDTIQWLTESSFDLRTTRPDVKIEGIPFAMILRNVEMVLVGEATHGTKEFAEIKHRLFRYLVEELGFRYFFIEADFTAGLAVDQYICGNGGDPVDVLKGLRFFHIVNKEGLALIKWMKSFNETKSASEKIRFFGIDCSISDDALRQLKDYFRRVDSVFYQEMKGIKLRNHRPELYTTKYRTLTLSRDTIEILKNRLTTNKTLYTDASSQINYKIALRLVEVLSHSFEIDQSDNGYGKREQFMAANVDWVLNEIDPGPEKAFLWAHNAHVKYSDMTEAKTGKWAGSSLGKILKNQLNGKVYAIGLDFNQGSFIANEIKQGIIGKRVWTVDQAPENTFPYFLSKTNMEALFMDFHSFQNENVVSWLKNKSVRSHDIGGAYYPDSDSLFRPYALLESFDGLIFINDTHEITLDLH